MAIFSLFVPQNIVTSLHKIFQTKPFVPFEVLNRPFFLFGPLHCEISKERNFFFTRFAQRCSQINLIILMWLKRNLKMKKVNHFLPSISDWWWNVIGHEHANHALLEIKCVCLLCFMLASFAFMERGKCGHLVWTRSLLVVWFRCLFFIMSRPQLVDGIAKGWGAAVFWRMAALLSEGDWWIKDERRTK